MSLQFIIDGYNITNHPGFNPPKKIRDTRVALLDYIRIHKLCGSRKNKVTVVFDGFPDSSAGFQDKGDIAVIFSRDNTADDKINEMVEAAGNPRSLVVVSDDKEIRIFARAQGAKIMAVEEFLARKEKSQKLDSLKPEINYSQMHQINQELRKVWLK